MKKKWIGLFLLSQFILSNTIQVAYSMEEEANGIKVQNEEQNQENTTENTTTDDENADDVLFVKKTSGNIKTYTKKQEYINPWVSLIQNNHRNYEGIEKELLNGQDVDQPLFDGNTMLILGASQGDFKLVELALKYDADTNLKDNMGNIALQYAVQSGNEEIVKSLLKNKGFNIKKINLKDKNGSSLLHKSMLYHDNLQIIQTLINMHVDLNIQDNNQQTPAHYAIANREWKNLEILLKNGANLFIQNSNGNTVEQMILMNIDAIHAVHIYPYLSSSGKLEIKNKFSKLPINWESQQITMNMETTTNSPSLIKK